MKFKREVSPDFFLASYAGIAKLKSATGPTSTVSSTGSVSVPPPQQTVNPVRPIPVKPVPNRTNNQQQHQQQRGNGNYYQQNNRGNQWNDNTQQEQSPARRSGANLPSAPNEQQVFVGSLPLEFTKEDLVECFKQFGNVIDAKIHAPVHDNKKVCLFRKQNKDLIFFLFSNRILVLLFLMIQLLHQKL